MATELLILFLILPFVLAKDLTAKPGQRIDLNCKLNFTQDITWYVDNGIIDAYFVNIFTCEKNQTGPCKPVSAVDPRANITVNRSKEASYLSLFPFQDETFECRSGNRVIKTYKIILINPKDITEYCNDSLPNIIESGGHQIQFSCGYIFERALSLEGKITLDGLGQNNFTVKNSSQSISGTIPLDDNFNNVSDAYCKIYFPDIDNTRSCTYPVIIKTKYVVEENGIIVQSDDESEIDWHLFGKDGREEDISNRSWTRDEGRSLLILEISEEDVGKLVVWRTKENDGKTNDSTIGFTVISDISGGSTNNPDSKDPNTAPSGDDGPFFVLTLLFLALWLITIVVGGIVLFCREEKCKSSPSDIHSTSVNASSPNSNQSSNVRPNGNVGSGENGTPFVRFTTEATNPDVSNTNNSAHTPVLERDDGNNDTLNRQSQGNSHLYFTLEKSPSASFRRATAPRWNPGDANSATLDQEQDSLWQGYATVGESNENATCSYDIGEYAEVGEHLLGKGPPVQSIRPPVRKKPGREEVKEDDISKLYGKVNK